MLKYYKKSMLKCHKKYDKKILGTDFANLKIVICKKHIRSCPLPIDFT